jgi:hypothetical protein
MPEVLALTGLVIATALYALLIRRRSALRTGLESMSRALTASNEVALTRLRGGLGSKPPPPEPVVVSDRRSGQERRRSYGRRWWRGRRAGGDRRRGAPSA